MGRAVDPQLPLKPIVVRGVTPVRAAQTLQCWNPSWTKGLIGTCNGEDDKHDNNNHTHGNNDNDDDDNEDGNDSNNDIERRSSRSCCYSLLTASLAWWLRRPPRERKVPGSNPACAGIFSGSSHTSDLKIGTPVATLPGAWRYRVSTGTGRPGVSIL